MLYASYNGYLRPYRVYNLAKITQVSIIHKGSKYSTFQYLVYVVNNTRKPIALYISVVYGPEC